MLPPGEEAALNGCESSPSCTGEVRRPNERPCRFE